MRITRGLTFPFLGLALITTIIYMAGIAALQNACYASDVSAGLGPGSNFATTAAFGLSDGWGSCRAVLRFYWYIFAFVIVTLIGLAIATGTPWGLAHSRPFWIGMITISAILMMIASEAFLGWTYVFDGIGGQWLYRMRTAAAGAIMSVVALVLLLMAVGTDWEAHRGGVAGPGGKVPVGGPVGTTGAAPGTGARVVDQV
jgi:hypothetical protein